jgi:hypothetical protein
MIDASRVAETFIPAVMFDLSQHTLKSFSATVNTRSVGLDDSTFISGNGTMILIFQGT